MPEAKPPEFRRRGVELDRQRLKPTAQIAHILGIAETCLRRGMSRMTTIPAEPRVSPQTGPRGYQGSTTPRGATWLGGCRGSCVLSVLPAY